MESTKIARINQLAKKARQTGLTPQEKEEQQRLRAEYVAAFRGNLKKQLDQIEVIRPDGSRERLRSKKK